MQRREILVSARPGDPPSRVDWVTLVDHQESIPMGLTVEQAYGWFRDNAQDFAAVVDGGTYFGLLSRGHLGFLPGTRFGLTILDRIRDFRPALATRALVITGDPGSSALDGDLLELNVPVLREPFTPQELLAQCRDLLQSTLTPSPRS